MSVLVLQNIHSATEEFRLAQLKEREEFIQVSTATANSQPTTMKDY